MSNLKTFVLLGTLGLLTFGGFSSANSLVNWNSVSSYTFSAGETFSFGDFECDRDYCDCFFYMGGENICYLSTEGDEYSEGDLMECNDYISDYINENGGGVLTIQNNTFTSLIMSVSGGDDNGNTGGGSGGGDDTGGNDNSLISSFTPVLTGLVNAINEFIPYVVYVGVGVISALLGFVAIKWLINWIRRKVLFPFK